MRKSIFWLVLPFMLLGATADAAGPPTLDLSKIERRIGKEPAYKEKPGYLLLAFGPLMRSF